MTYSWVSVLGHLEYYLKLGSVKMLRWRRGGGLPHSLHFPWPTFFVGSDSLERRPAECGIILKAGEGGGGGWVVGGCSCRVT